MPAGAGPEQVLAWLERARRAPSAHNAQPARWRWLPGDRVRLYLDSGRTLPASDPTGRDTVIGLGAAWEGLRLALSEDGLGLQPPERPSADGGRPGPAVTGEGPPRPDGLRAVAQSRILEGADPLSLADAVLRRRTWRGRFPPADGADLVELHRLVRTWPDAGLLASPADVDAAARLHDRCTRRLLSDRSYHRELYGWIRFTPRQEGWDLDGLTADALGMSRLEGRLARHLFRAGPFRLLQATRLAGPLLSEAAATRSATGLLVLLAERDESQLATGRRFYRRWLALTAIGFTACPMSALVDMTFGRRWLEGRLGGIAPGREVMSVLRVGPTPDRPMPESPRLSPDELLV